MSAVARELTEAGRIARDGVASQLRARRDADGGGLRAKDEPGRAGVAARSRGGGLFPVIAAATIVAKDESVEIRYPEIVRKYNDGRPPAQPPRRIVGANETTLLQLGRRMIKAIRVEARREGVSR